MAYNGSCIDNYPLGVSASDPYFYPPDDPECSKCNYSLEEGWNYCPNCGEETGFGRDYEAEYGDFMYDLKNDR